MTVSFAEHLELLVSHGRATLACLELLAPQCALPPRGDPAHQAAAEHWATLEIWAWSLENPAAHWSRREEPRTPATYAALVAGIGAELIRLEAALLRSGPKMEVDYLGRPGSAAEVARLLAHEAIALAHATSLAADEPAPPPSPRIASDGIDQALKQWETSGEAARSRPETVAIRTSDTGSVWHLALAVEDEFRLVPSASTAAVVAGPAVDVLWWLHGHADPAGGVEVHGTAGTVERLRSALMHPEPELPKRRRWFGGRR